MQCFKSKRTTFANFFLRNQWSVRPASCCVRQPRTWQICGKILGSFGRIVLSHDQKEKKSSDFAPSPGQFRTPEQRPIVRSPAKTMRQFDLPFRPQFSGYQLISSCISQCRISCRAGESWQGSRRSCPDRKTTRSVSDAGYITPKIRHASGLQHILAYWW